MFFRTMLWLFLCINVFSPVHGREKITLATLDWEPYIGREMKDQGYLALIVREAFRLSRMDVDIRFHQWSRVVGLAKKGRVDGYFPEYYADNITSYALFSDPIPAGPLGFFTRRDRDIRFTALEDLKEYRIGIVKGYINSADFDGADFLDKHPVKNDLSNLRLLLAGRVDLMVADKYVGFHLLRRHMPDKIAEIKFLPTILDRKDIFVCISTQTPQARRFLKAFNQGLSRMKANGTLDILVRGFTQTPPPLP